MIIENVGNLVCPAEFRVGEDARIMICSVTEGEEKPLKYPLMFRACELVVVNKIDLLPHLDFDLDRLLANIDTVNPGARVMLVEREDRRGDRGVARVARRGARARRGGSGRLSPAATGALTARVDELLARRLEAGSDLLRRPRPSGSRAAATGWRSGSRAAAAWSRSGARRPRAPTLATSRSSSSIR